VRRQKTSREKLGNIVSTLLIIIGAVGLLTYLLYLRGPGNAILYYALIALMVLGIFLALTLATLYLTREVEYQKGLNNYEHGLTYF
jgi:membrane protein YdbS with pleckstrin-like domain